jgi:hypothetical protein
MLSADIPGLKIERADEDNGESLITLVQDDACGNIDTVILHPIHVRYLAEHMGLLELADQQSQKTIVALKRRLETLFDRIDFMHDWLCNHSDTRHADLEFEQTYATATVDIAYELLRESGIEPISLITQDEPIAKVVAKPPRATPAKPAQQPLI